MVQLTQKKIALFLLFRQKMTIAMIMNCPHKVQQCFKIKIVQEVRRVCCLCIAGGKPFWFEHLVVLLIWYYFS